LPVKQAADLFERLYEARVTAASIFPGVGGVVQALKEERFVRQWNVVEELKEEEPKEEEPKEEEKKGKS